MRLVLTLICFSSFAGVVIQSAKQNKSRDKGCPEPSKTYHGSPSIISFKDSVNKVKKSARNYSKSWKESSRYKDLARNITLDQLETVPNSTLWGFNFFSKNLQWIESAIKPILKAAKLKPKERKKTAKRYKKLLNDWCNMLNLVRQIKPISGEMPKKFNFKETDGNVIDFKRKVLRIVELLNRFVSCLRKVSKGATALDDISKKLIEKCNSKVRKKRGKGKGKKKGRKKDRKRKTKPGGGRKKKKNNKKDRKRKKNKRKNNESKGKET